MEFSIPCIECAKVFGQVSITSHIKRFGMNNYYLNTTEKLNALEKLFKDQRRLLVVLHNNPDPDAIASAFALSFLVKKLFQVQSTLAYGGIIGRAENLAMVRELKIHLLRISRIRFNRYDRIAMVDTQPGAGNNALPKDVRCHVVIDHHPRRRGLKADFIHIDTEYGATATVLIEWLMAGRLDIPADLATALAYAIRTETQDLGRETSRRDIDAYLNVYPRANMRKLARIAYPKLPHSYFTTLGSGLKRALTYRHLICVHLGDIPIPELVAEIADLMMRHKHIGWVLCTGRFSDNLIISLRSSNPKAQAGKIIKRVVPNRNMAGGHDTFAGGMIPLSDYSGDNTDHLEEHLTEEFSRIMGYPDADWKPLLDV